MAIVQGGRPIEFGHGPLAAWLPVYCVERGPCGTSALICLTRPYGLAGMDIAAPIARLLKKCVMTSLDSNARARDELVDLIRSQLNTLEKEAFGVVIEDSHERSCQLFAKLIDQEAAA